MEFVFIAGGALFIPVFIAIVAIGLLGVGLAIEIGALATETVTLRSFPAAWASRRHKRHARVPALTDGANVWSRLRFLKAPAIAHWTLWLSLAAAGMLIAIIAIPAMNYLLFEHCLRVALRGIERSHGIAVTYQSAEGNWLKGRAKLGGARAVRRGHAISDFDLTIDGLDVDCDARRIISGEFAIESVVARSVRGRFTKNGRRDPSQPRQHYTIDRLTIGDMQLDYVDRSRPPRVLRVPLQVMSLEVNDYRSRWALFDVLFRSHTRGTVHGRPFEITSRTATDAHEAEFKVTDLPLSLLGRRISAPLGGRVDGLVDANIQTSWQPSDESTELKMRCRLVAHNFSVQMPNNPIARAAGPAMATRVPRNVPLEFDLAMNKQVFDGQTSLLDSGILESIGNEASRQRRQATPRSTSGIDKAFSRFSSGVRSLIKPGGR
jgi:hypothetical protein